MKRDPAFADEAPGQLQDYDLFVVGGKVGPEAASSRQYGRLSVRVRLDPSEILPKGQESHYVQTIMPYSEDKLRQVILFFLERINNVHLGRTKLMKLLYYVDFGHFEKHDVSVTGAKYRRLPHGPYPDKIEKVIDRMTKDGLIAEMKQKRGPYEQRRLLTCTARFDAARFNGAELQTLEQVAADWADSTAAEIEAASHREAPWASTDDGKAIDYELAHFRRPIGAEPLDGELAKSNVLANYLAALN